MKFDPKLKGKYHVPQCDNNYNPPKCSEFYHDQEQSPGHPRGDGSCKDNCDCGKNPCGEYLVRNHDRVRKLHWYALSLHREHSLTTSCAASGTIGMAQCCRSSW